MKGSTIQYKVKWKNYSNIHNSWVIILYNYFIKFLIDPIQSYKIS